jgi:hypothetical protein
MKKFMHALVDQRRKGFGDTGCRGLLQRDEHDVVKAVAVKAAHGRKIALDETSKEFWKGGTGRCKR